MGTAPPSRLIRRAEVQQKTGISVSGIYARMAKGEFPKAVPLGTGMAVAWIESEIDEWIASRVAERNAR